MASANAMTDKDNIRLISNQQPDKSEAEEAALAVEFAAFLELLKSKGVPEDAAVSTAMYRFYSTRRK
jgi:hypothetical protein